VKEDKNLDLIQEHYGMIHGLDSFDLKQESSSGH